MIDLDAIRARCEAATPEPWASMRDGNQYVDTGYLPTARCVGASRIDGIVRPWNPHAYVQHGFKPTEFETCRFLDADADFIAAARADVPALLAEVERLRALLARVPHLEGVREANGTLGARVVSEHLVPPPHAECARLNGACALSETP